MFLDPAWSAKILLAFSLLRKRKLEPWLPRCPSRHYHHECALLFPSAHDEGTRRGAPDRPPICKWNACLCSCLRGEGAQAPHLVVQPRCGCISIDGGERGTKLLTWIIRLPF